MKNVLKIFSKYYKDKICKIKRYLNIATGYSKSIYSTNPKDIFKTSEKEKKGDKNDVPNSP